jgi:hypothetical protein
MAFYLNWICCKLENDSPQKHLRANFIDAVFASTNLNYAIHRNGGGTQYLVFEETTHEPFH